jgi:7,8-dihydro-6-hydroxymethylpterin-pyrophosphokinase
MKERRFVLEPLAQIAPSLIIPNETKTIAELLADIC